MLRPYSAWPRRGRGGQGSCSFCPALPPGCRRFPYTVISRTSRHRSSSLRTVSIRSLSFSRPRPMSLDILLYVRSFPMPSHLVAPRPSVLMSAMRFRTDDAQSLPARRRWAFADGAGRPRVIDNRTTGRHRPRFLGRRRTRRTREESFRIIIVVVALIIIGVC